jgi:hypothetical protein
VALALNQKVRQLSPYSDGTGECEVVQPRTSRDRTALLHFCAVASAGSIAVERLTGCADRSHGDHHSMEQRLGGLSTRQAVEVLHEGRALADRIINRRWTEICSLARRLHQCGRLDYRGISGIIDCR